MSDAKVIDFAPARASALFSDGASAPLSDQCFNQAQGPPFEASGRGASRPLSDRASTELSDRASAGLWEWCAAKSKQAAVIIALGKVRLAPTTNEYSYPVYATGPSSINGESILSS